MSSTKIPLFKIEDYILDGPIGYSIGTYYAREKNDKVSCYVIKKMCFMNKEEREIYVNDIESF